MKNLLFLALLAPGLAYSIQLNVTNVTCGGVLTGSANDPNTPCGAMVQELRNYEDLPDVPIDTYAEGISDSNAFAIKGQGSDYADNFSLFSVKASAGAALKGDLDEVSDNPEAAEGIGLGGAITIGLNLDLLPIDKIGPIEFKKLDVFASFFSYSLDQDMDQTTLEGDISSFGVYARYRLIDAVDFVPGNLLQWGGLHLHTGYQRSSMNISISQDLEDQKVESNGATAQFQNGFAKFDIESQTSFIPVEVSTFFRMAYVFTVYTGAGFDYNLGDTELDLTAAGNVAGTGAATGFSADVDASENGSGGPEATNFRAFAGLQFNVPFVRVYAQVNKALGSDLIGANAGIKILW